MLSPSIKKLNNAVKGNIEYSWLGELIGKKILNWSSYHPFNLPKAAGAARVKFSLNQRLG